MACELEADDAPTATYTPVRALTRPVLTAAGPDSASVSPPARFLEITDALSINDPWDSRASTTVRPPHRHCRPPVCHRRGETITRVIQTHLQMAIPASTSCRKARSASEWTCPRESRGRRFVRFRPSRLNTPPSAPLESRYSPAQRLLPDSSHQLAGFTGQTQRGAGAELGSSLILLIWAKTCSTRRSSEPVLRSGRLPEETRGVLRMARGGGWR
jgi:hypothetical protein